jgi:hypothetical protein
MSAACANPNADFTSIHAARKFATFSKNWLLAQVRIALWFPE